MHAQLSELMASRREGRRPDPEKLEALALQVAAEEDYLLGKRSYRSDPSG